MAAHRLTDLLSIDLEGSETIGAIRTDRSTTFTWRGDSDGLPAALAALNGFSEGASYLVGHNVIEHDLELLAKHASDLKLLDLATIDTLYLSPLVYAENPYHHLVKQYQEPALARAQVNDPLRDLGSRRAEAPAIPQTTAGRRWVPTRLNHVTTPQDDLRPGYATNGISVAAYIPIKDDLTASSKFFRRPHRLTAPASVIIPGWIQCNSRRDISRQGCRSLTDIKKCV